MPTQKFRIPFKNIGSQEVELEFTFLKTSRATNEPAMERRNSMKDASRPVNL